MALHITDRADFLTLILTARLTRLMAVARKNGASSNPTEAPAENTCAIVVPEVCTQRPNLFSGTVEKKEHTLTHKTGTCTHRKRVKSYTRTRSRGITCSSQSVGVRASVDKIINGLYAESMSPASLYVTKTWTTTRYIWSSPGSGQQKAHNRLFQSVFLVCQEEVSKGAACP